MSLFGVERFTDNGILYLCICLVVKATIALCAKDTLVTELQWHSYRIVMIKMTKNYLALNIRKQQARE